MVHSTRFPSAFLSGAVRGSFAALALLCCLLCPVQEGRAQFGPSINRMSAANWYFGRNAGLSFTNGTPQAVTNGMVNTFGGAAAMSDPATGRLLFYTDGRTVWNTNHGPMPNGEGLLGGETARQSALIVPSPEDPAIFYIFTTGGTGGATSSVRYSVVDMRLQDGLGDVTEKNQSLLSNAAEKIAATRHCNGRDYWVIVHEGRQNRFFVYPLTEEGLGNAIISTVGLSYTADADREGVFQISPNGRFAAAATPAKSMVELFDFDNATGLITNQRVLTADNGRYWGLEFSPDNSKLYAVTAPEGSEPARLYQYNLAAGNLTAIRNSRYELHVMPANVAGGEPQLGPDGKIYISWADRQVLAAVENPNGLRDGAMYNHQALNLAGRAAGQSLPNFIDSDIPGVTTGFVDLSVKVEFDRTRVEHGETVICRLIICNGSANDVRRASVSIQFPIELKNMNPPPGGTYIIDTVPAGGCDTVEINLLAGGREGTVSLCARLVNVAPSFYCMIPDSGCASITLVTPSDPNIVDYEYHFKSRCPGFTEGVQVLFNSRRFNDTIIDVQFEGEFASSFAYGGERPIRFAIHPTSDQWLPIVLHHRLPGQISAVMKLVTSSGDVFRVRLISEVDPSVTPVFAVGEVLVRARSGVVDTCITVTNRSGMRLVINDSIWISRANEGGMRLEPLSLPQYLPDGGTMQLCFSITDPAVGLSDTLLIGGYENTDFIPACVHQLIVLKGIRADSVITSVASAGNLDAALRVIPNPVAGNGTIELTLEKRERLRLTVVDEGGREVLPLADREFGAGRHVLTFDVGTLPSGAYSVLVQGERGRLVRAIQVVR